MPAVYYYVPDARAVDESEGVLNLDVLDKFGLAPAFRSWLRVPDETVYLAHEDGFYLWRKPRTGDSTRPPVFTHDAESLPVKNGARVFYVEGTPGQFTPDSLCRKAVINGFAYPVADLQGNVWSIPVVTSPSQSRVGIGCNWSVSASGKLEKTPDPEHDDLWPMINKAADMVRSEHEADEQDLLDIMLRILQVDYGVIAADIAAMEKLNGPIVNQQFVLSVIGAACDFNLLEDLGKKKLPAESPNSTHGPTDDCRSTQLASERS